jgi:phytoene dehydrogenase-like protein
MTPAYDVVILGAGLSGFATALRLAMEGQRVAVLEAHAWPGGCAGFWRTRDFSFDVGATTFVDFDPDGVCGRWLDGVGVSVDGERLPGYQAWLADRTITLWRDPARWREARGRGFGDDAGHQRFCSLIDDLEQTFWAATRSGSVVMPIRTMAEAWRAAGSVPVHRWPLARYLGWTVGDALGACGIADDRALRACVTMLLEDTVHAGVEDAPLINGAMGMAIRGAGLTRFRGGARGLWLPLIKRLRTLGGSLLLHRPAQRVVGDGAGYRVDTPLGPVYAPTVVSSLPVEATAKLGPPALAEALAPYIARDHAHRGGACVLFLGVPEAEVDDHALTHHGVCARGPGDLTAFVSVSSAGDRASAPEGHRAVMVSTHVDLPPWTALSPEDYPSAKAAIGERLLAAARRVYPNLGADARVRSVGTPVTYARFTGRPDGAVGGVRQRLSNTNQRAVPDDLGVPGLFVVGDTTWPGLGTVSCVVGSGVVAERILGR